MKLSKAQNEVMTMAKKQIDEARKYDYPEWLKETNSWYQVDENESEEYKAFKEKAYRDAVNEGHHKEYWEMARNGIGIVNCNSRTIQTLEKLGLIEIIEDGRSHTDLIKVLNY